MSNVLDKVEIKLMNLRNLSSMTLNCIYLIQKGTYTEKEMKDNIYTGITGIEMYVKELVDLIKQEG